MNRNNDDYVGRLTREETEDLLKVVLLEVDTAQLIMAILATYDAEEIEELKIRLAEFA